MNGYLSAILGTLLGLAVIAAATVLAWHRVIDGQATVALFSTLIGGAGGGGIAIAAHKAATKTTDGG